jgi:hypothetical protein
MYGVQVTNYKATSTNWLPMRHTVSTLLDAKPERVWAELQRPELLAYVAAPLVVFHPVEPESFPEQWDDDEYRVTLLLFGMIPLGEQTIRTSKVRVEDTAGEQFYQLRDDGTGRLASGWDHLISVRETPDGKTVYTDEIAVEAGVLTPVIWLFAAIFYRHRQRRWRKVVANDFEY